MQASVLPLNVPKGSLFEGVATEEFTYTTSSPHFSSGMVERAKRERAWKSPHPRKGDTGRGGIFLSPRRPPRRVSPFLAWGDFDARSRFARSTIPEEKWGTTRSLEFTVIF